MEYTFLFFGRRPSERIRPHPSPTHRRETYEKRVPKILHGSSFTRNTPAKSYHTHGGNIFGPDFAHKILKPGQQRRPEDLQSRFRRGYFGLRQTLQAEKWGLPISQDATGAFNDLLPILVFADNFWIIAKSPEELQMMSNIWFRGVPSPGGAFHTKSARGQRRSLIWAAGGK